MAYRAEVSSYFDNSIKAFTVPDIDGGYIPQGIAYDSASDNIFLTGYMGNGSDSPIYILNRETGSFIKKIKMQDETGQKFNGHSGGLSVLGDKVYVAGSTKACMYVFSLKELLEAADGSSVAAEQKISLKTDGDFMRVSFTSCDDSLVYAGEFHKGAIFYTHASHLVEDGRIKQKAYLMGFSVDDDSAVPVKVYSIPDSIQGACFDGDYVYLSQSKGMLSGRILAYNLKELPQAGTRTVLGKEIPLYILSEKNASKITAIPPMCEELVTADGKLYTIFEAASNRYIIGKFMGLKSVYATPVEFFR
ncbi:MAG: hypothetical protein K6C96_04270 [Butyrivibrio sp.]|nr:hypothetical protein [Butyrivibrio sp.]